MTTIPREIVQFEASGEFKKHLEAEAKRLNLTLGAYIEYLAKRQSAGIPAEQFDRIVGEVFGRFGPTMRKLAQ